ncbi:MAG TPA: protein kinase [Candidatus Acidoferrum sp.]|jgi:serine/threonine protein kinase/tetratricopeptide (TPR) repeat protein
MIDRTISHFRILEKLGAGGMGVVYKAVDTRLDRSVALKFLPDGMAQDTQALERFRREAHAASALNHPGICTIYDIGEQDHLPFIAMEFIDGETLREHIHGHPLTIEKILDLGIQISDAIDAAHTQGIIHRDIKPSNVFVTKRGQAKVLDFGLAKLVRKDVLGLGAGDSSTKSTEESISIVGIISGTPAYMSPEHVRGDDLDPRADVFALGLLLYEMATGKPAFGGRTGGAIIEAILTRTPASVRSLNPQLPPQLEEIINKCIEKDRDQRYATAAAVRADLSQLKRVTESGQVAAPATVTLPAATSDLPRRRSVSWKVAAGSAIVIVVLAIGGWLYNTRHAHALTQADTVVLANFTNKTGDPVFDETLRQGFAAQLQQSPFLSLVSEPRIQQELRLMGIPPESKLTPKMSGELCQRLGSKAFLAGTISNIGNQYVIGVSATNCQTGDYVAQEQVTANGKEAVLSALGSASTRLREQLGESLKTIQKLDTPIEQATTPSLEALQAYSLGRRNMWVKADYTAAVPLLERSIQLDPNFAMAYAILGTTYHNLGEKNLAAENTGKSYALRTRVSEWEKFYIESHYYDFVTGDLENARKVYELWAQIYPREEVAPTNLGVVFQTLGQHDKALAEFREAMRISPPDSLSYTNLVLGYTYLKHLDEANAAAQEAISKSFDSGALRINLYDLAFLRSDAAGMAEQVAWAAGKPGNENVMLVLESGTAAYSGKVSKARELSRQASSSTGHSDDKEMAADNEAGAALWEALYGNGAEAKQRAAASLATLSGRDTQYVAALALALSGDAMHAQKIADDLDKRFPADTVVRLNYLPTVRAQIALSVPGNSPKAVEILTVASPYELGVPGSNTLRTNLYPIYVRGEALLASKQGAAAAAEFQKILDWSSVALNEPIGALAHLGLGRAQAIAGDTPKARAAYDDFFKIWKDADPNVPILIQAKSEYAKLQ